jgi:hypothetical protein
VGETGGGGEVAGAERCVGRHGPGFDPAIHVFVASRKEDVDARHKTGHDEVWAPTHGWNRIFTLAGVEKPR